MFQLSKGSLRKILDGTNVTDPILQILQIKNIQNTNGDAITRYKITLFDGDMQHTFGILATQKNSLIENDELRIGSVIKLNEYAANVLSKEPQKVVIILMNFDILGEMELHSSSSNSHADAKVNNENKEPSVVPTSPVKPATASSSSSSSSSVVAPANKFYKPDVLKQPNKSDTLKNNNSAAGNQCTPGQFNGFKIFGISNLNPYQNKWSIKVRVTNKTNVRTWANSRGEGKVFSVDFIDQTGEIKANVFGEQCEKYYDMFQIDKCYYVSKAQLKTANKQYSTLKNDYEMTFGQETVVECCDDDGGDDAIPRINLDLVPLSEIANKSVNDLVDVIGVLRTCSEVTTIVSKATSKELKKRELHIVDNSNHAVTVTLWGKQAEDFDGADNPVIVCKGVKIGEYNGRTLGTLMSSIIMINPDIPEAHTLRGWYDQGGCSESITDLSSNGAGGGGAGGGGGASMSQSNWKTLDQIADDQMGMGDKADYFSCIAAVTFASKDKALYMACSGENCKKKVIDQNNGKYRCEKCSKDFDNFKWNMILQVACADFGEQHWITCFQESAEMILGVNTADLGDMKTQNVTKYDEVFSNCLFKEYTFKVRAKMETYNDERKLKLSVVNCEPVDYVAASKRLLQKLKIYANSQN